jgi:hypothetical protein
LYDQEAEVMSNGGPVHVKMMYSEQRVVLVRNDHRADVLVRRQILRERALTSPRRRSQNQHHCHENAEKPIHTLSSWTIEMRQALPAVGIKYSENGRKGL